MVASFTRIKLSMLCLKRRVIEILLVHLSQLLLPVDSLYAQTATVNDLVSSEALYWLVILSISFVQGATNGLLSLVFRRFLFQEAGYRWTEAFWSGFPIAFLCAVFIDGLMDVATLGSLAFSFASSLFIILNCLGVYIVSKWAARE